MSEPKPKTIAQAYAEATDEAIRQTNENRERFKEMSRERNAAPRPDPAPTATDLARDALQSEFNDLDVSGALVHAVEMFVEAKIREAYATSVVKASDIEPARYSIPADIWEAATKRAILAEREACAKVAEAETLTGERPYWMSEAVGEVVRSAVQATAKSIASSIRNRTET